MRVRLSVFRDRWNMHSLTREPTICVGLSFLYFRDFSSNKELNARSKVGAKSVWPTNSLTTQVRKEDWEPNSTQQFLNREELKSSLSHTPSTPTHDVSRATPFSSQLDNGGLYTYGRSKNICKYPAFTDGFSPFEIRTKIRQKRVNVSFGCLRMSWWRKKFADFIVIFMACWPCEWTDIVLVDLSPGMRNVHLRFPPVTQRRRLVKHSINRPFALCQFCFPNTDHMTMHGRVFSFKAGHFHART